MKAVCAVCGDMFTTIFTQAKTCGRPTCRVEHARRERNARKATARQDRRNNWDGRQARTPPRPEPPPLIACAWCRGYGTDTHGRPHHAPNCPHRD